MKKIRVVVPDYTTYRAQFLDAETGEPIEGSVLAADWHMAVGRNSTLSLTLLKHEMDVRTENAELKFIPAVKIALMRKLREQLDTLSDGLASHLAGTLANTEIADWEEILRSLLNRYEVNIMAKLEDLLYQDNPAWPNLDTAFLALTELERAYYLQQIRQLLDLPPEERERFNLKLAREGN